MRDPARGLTYATGDRRDATGGTRIHPGPQSADPDGAGRYVVRADLGRRLGQIRSEMTSPKGQSSNVYRLDMGP